MRKINFDVFIAEKKARYGRLRMLRIRGARRKPRDPEERRALMRQDYRRYQQWLRDGTLVLVAPRKYMVKV